MALVLQNEKLEKMDCFKSYLSHDVHQSSFAFPKNSDVLQFEISKKGLNSGQFFS